MNLRALCGGLILSRRLGSLQNLLCIFDQRHIDHLAVQRIRTFAFFLIGLKCFDDSFSISNCFTTRRECGLDRLHLRGMDDLLADESQPRAELRFDSQGLDVLVIDRDNVNGLLIICCTGHNDRRPRIQQFNRILRADRAIARRKILSAENDRLQPQMRRDLLEI